MTSLGFQPNCMSGFREYYILDEGRAIGGSKSSINFRILLSSSSRLIFGTNPSP